MDALQVEAYVVSTFGGVEQCRKAILLDFFRHAFDGSGAGWWMPRKGACLPSSGLCAQCTWHAANFRRLPPAVAAADNFFDAGSCIDGRLTSAWTWCSKIEKKPYYNCFKLCGFVGFDGDFK